jgi:hypothetical protein
LQVLPSLQEVPLGTAACWHPEAGTHVSVLQGLLSAQSRVVPGVQEPAWQVSVPLHRFVSLHEVPFATAVFVHAPAAHASVVHALLSSQSPGTLHDTHPPSGVWTHPEIALQESVVQALVSSQSSPTPALQLPP